MATIHLIGGEKGGVGKSLMSRLLAQYFIDHSMPFIGFDADRSHGALLRFYASYTTPVIIDDFQSLDRMVESAAAEPDRRVLVDLAAQTHLPLSRWMEDSRLIETAKECNIQLRYWHVMDSGKDSIPLQGLQIRRPCALALTVATQYPMGLIVVNGTMNPSKLAHYLQKR